MLNYQHLFKPQDRLFLPSTPSLKTDGIALDRQHLGREKVVQEIFETALEKQFVVLGSPAATGKTSLLQLLEQALKVRAKEKQQECRVIRFHTVDIGADALIRQLEKKGISNDVEVLRQHKNTWLLIDDAQNVYASKYAPFWHIVVKGIISAGVLGQNLFVVIATTYNLATPESPVNLSLLPQVTVDVEESEVKELFRMHTEHWNLNNWFEYRNSLLQISRINSRKEDAYHIGIVMRGIQRLERMRKECDDFSEDKALRDLRGASFAEFMERCFKTRDDVVTPKLKKVLLDVVIADATQESLSIADDKDLAPFVRAGILTREGQFACIAAQWYYNRFCFPNRPSSSPESLEELISSAVASISAKRLRDTLEDGFPKEATFQLLFNEALSEHLPIQNIVIPELNTFAVDSQDSSADPQTGELDFYINGSKKWCIELLRQGHKIGEHVARFHEKTGKYRKVDMNDWIVVDCRGPKQGSGVTGHPQNRCTLYFSKDFKTCHCEMRGEPGFDITLAD